MQYYIMIFAAALLYSMQFLFNQKFEEKTGATVSNAILFAGSYAFLMAIPLYGIELFTNGFSLSFPATSLLLAAAFAAVRVCAIYVAMKSFAVVNLANYSIYIMLGGMILPALFGFLFQKEGFTWVKGVCILLIAVALFFTHEKGKGTWKEKAVFALVFCLNGAEAIITSIHQKSTAPTVGTFCFLAYSSTFSFLACLVIYLLREKKLPRFPGNTILFPAGYAISNGTAEVLAFFALTHLDTSVQYPIITGGTIAFSALISLCRREKLTVKNAVAVAIALAASVCMAF